MHCEEIILCRKRLSTHIYTNLYLRKYCLVECQVGFSWVRKSDIYEEITTTEAQKAAIVDFAPLHHDKSPKIFQTSVIIFDKI